jgi:hypothetical protein
MNENIHYLFNNFTGESLEWVNLPLPPYNVGHTFIAKI